MPTYRGYGLRIASHLELPDLGRPIDASIVPDADVLCAAGDPADPSADGLLLPHGLWLDGERIGIDVPDVGRFVCEGGRRVVVRREAGASDEVVRLFLLGSAMGALMMQRGHLVLHGNAFRVGDACAVVVGHSGAGKSTLAAEMHRRGHDVLSDDVVPIDQAGRALPGWPRIKLWRDALDRIGVSPDRLRRVRDAHDKFHLPLARPELPALPVRWIYALDRHDGPVDITPLTGAAVFTSLHEHAYRNELLVGPLRDAHLRQAAALAGRARVARLDRPYGTDSVSLSAEAMLADIGKKPA